VCAHTYLLFNPLIPSITDWLNKCLHLKSISEQVKFSYKQRNFLKKIKKRNKLSYKLPEKNVNMTEKSFVHVCQAGIQQVPKTSPNS